MQPALIQLSGPNRGNVEVFEKRLIRIGTDRTNDLVIDPSLHPGAAPFQAEIRWEEGSFLLTEIAGTGLWVNGQEVSDAFLAPGDSFQLGRDGPQFRFRTCRDREECKTLQ